MAQYRHLALAVGALLVPGAGGTAQPSNSLWSGPWEVILFEVRSSGRPVTSWRLLADGEDGYRWVEKLLSRLPDSAPDYDDCRDRLTDLPYGTIRPTRDATTITDKVCIVEMTARRGAAS